MLGIRACYREYLSTHVYHMGELGVWACRHCLRPCIICDSHVMTLISMNSDGETRTWLLKCAAQQSDMPVVANSEMDAGAPGCLGLDPAAVSRHWKVWTGRARRRSCSQLRVLGQPQRDRCNGTAWLGGAAGICRPSEILQQVSGRQQDSVP